MALFSVYLGKYLIKIWIKSRINILLVIKSKQSEHAGGYDKEEKAARAYDLAALKYWGTTTTTNFPVS